jgi:LPXTG-motif cell wall-anchored protein
MKNLNFVFLIGLLFIWIFFNNIFADVSVSEVSITPNILRPGTNAVVSMKISNSAQYTINDVRAEPSSVSGINIGGQYYLGDYKNSGYGYLSIPFSIDQKVDSGAYYINIRFTWLNGTEGFTKNVQIPINVRDEPIFYIETPNTKIYTEGEFDLNLKIKNSGGKADFIRLNIDSEYFYQVGQNKISIDSLKKNEEKEVVLKLKMKQEADSGEYNLPINLTYINGLGEEKTSQEKIKINVIKSKPDIRIELDQTQDVFPGLEQKIKLIVKNIGDKKAYFVRVGTSKSDVLTVLDGNYAVLGDIEPNSYKILELKVGVKDLKPGYYSQEFEIKSKDENGNERMVENYSLNMNIKSKPELEVFLSSKPSPLVENQEHVLTVLVSNVGVSAVKSLTVKINSNDFELLDLQNEQYIGSLLDDDFSSVQFRVMTKKANENAKVKVQLKFLDSYNKQQTKEFEIPVSIIKERKNGTNNQMFVVIGALVVIAAAIWYFKFRKKSKPQNN